MERITANSLLKPLLAIPEPRLFNVEPREHLDHDLKECTLGYHVGLGESRNQARFLIERGLKDGHTILSEFLLQSLWTEEKEEKELKA